MHPTGTVRLACTDCHGGDSTATLPPGENSKTPEYEQIKNRAHVQPSDPVLTERSGNQQRLYTKWLRGSYEYVRFVNPGDLRVAAATCGTAGCHAQEVMKVKTSMMTHGAMLWGAALYNNGSFPLKNARFGESYSSSGVPQVIRTVPAPTPDEVRLKGILPELTPLERWEISQPGNVLRVFERGGEKKGEIGNPDREEESGRPDDKLGERGFGTLLRTDPVFLGLQKTRLLDPMLSLPGTNDEPGDYRGSGCTACHVYLCERSLAGTFRPLRALRAHGGERLFRSNRRQERIRTSDPPQFHAGHSLEPVHDLPCSSRNEHGDHLLRVHVVGQRIRRRSDVSARAAQSYKRRKISAGAQESGRRGGTRAMVESRFPRTTARPNSIPD